MVLTKKINLILTYIVSLVLLTSFYACNKKDAATPFANTVADADNNVYPFVTIGKQTWMAANLKTTKYNDGTAIRDAQSDTAWQFSDYYNRLDTGAYCWYNTHTGQDSLVTKYGRLYNFYAVNTGKLCPTGWHVPSDEDWTILEDTLTNLGLNATALKDKRWTNTIANNKTGFSALPAGLRQNLGSFNGIDLTSVFWTSTQIGTVSVARGMIYNNLIITKEAANDKRSGLSVRCIKN